jgi:transcriptional regulator with XRE-family HTH domain
MDLALDVGVSTRHLSFVETGRSRPSPELVLALAHHLEVPIANRAAVALTHGLPDAVLGPPLNVYRLCLHPDGLAGRTTNFIDWASYLIQQLRRSITLTGDPALRALLDEVSSYPNVARIDVTIDELAIELFFPADGSSDDMLRDLSTADHI